MGMKIPCSGAVYDHEEIDNIKDAALTFYNVEGKYTEEFEKGLCAFFGIKYCVLCNSGSSANLLAITALELPSGSEVITTALAFPTTVNPIIQNNLIPVFVDISMDTLNIDTVQLERAITLRTKAIMVSHTLGNPAQMDEVLRIANRYQLLVIEDNCDSLGSRYQDHKTGTFGIASTLSFYPAHHITTGEGGAVMTNDHVLYKRLMSYRNWGRDCMCPPGNDNLCGNRFSHHYRQLPYGYDHKYVYTKIGYNLKMTDIQASVGVAQLKKLPDFIKKRRHNYARLQDGLSKYSEFFDFPYETGYASWFSFPIICKPDVKNDKIIEYLEIKGVATRRMFAGNILRQPAYEKIRHECPYELSNTDNVVNSGFWVGVYPGLTDEHIDYLIEQFRGYKW